MSCCDIGKINPTLKVGYSCYLMDISAILEYQNMLALSLAYTNFDFIYNPDYFAKFINPKPAEEYIDKENELVITIDTDAVYNKDFSKYIYKGIDELNLFSINDFDHEFLTDLGYINEKYLQRNLPVVYTNDHYYVYDDYRKRTIDMFQYHSAGHAAVLVSVDLNKGTCNVIDKFFSFVGEIPICSYINAIKSDYLTEKSAHYVKINEYNGITEAERLQVLFKNNIDNSLQDSVIIENKKYNKNLTALSLFIDNFEGHLYELTEQKHKYSPQFTTKLLQPVMLNKRGFCHLLSYIKNIIDVKEIVDIEILCKDISSLWIRIDALCDKCFFEGNTIIQYKDRLLKVIKEIYEKEKIVFNKLSNVKNKL